jgi:hypothetical protein
MMQPKVNSLDVFFGEYEGGTTGVKLVVEIEGGEWDMNDPIGTALRIAHSIIAHANTITVESFEQIDHSAQADGDSGNETETIYDRIMKRMST